MTANKESWRRSLYNFTSDVAVNRRIKLSEYSSNGLLIAWLPVYKNTLIAKDKYHKNATKAITVIHKAYFKLLLQRLTTGWKQLKIIQPRHNQYRSFRFNQKMRLHSRYGARPTKRTTRNLGVSARWKANIFHFATSRSRILNFCIWSICVTSYCRVPNCFVYGIINICLRGVGDMHLHFGSTHTIFTWNFIFIAFLQTPEFCQNFIVVFRLS